MATREDDPGQRVEEDAPTEVTADPTAAASQAAEQAPGASTRKKKGRARRVLSRIGCGVGVVFGLLGVALCGTGSWLLTPGGQSRITREVEGLVTGLMNEGELEIGDLSTNLLTYVEVDDVALRDGSGRAVVSLRHARAELDLTSLLSLTVHVTSLSAQGLDADLQLDQDGNLDVVRMFATEPDPDAPPFEGLPVDLLFDQIDLTDSHVRFSGPDVQTVEVDALSLKGAFEGRGLRYAVTDLDVDGDLVQPEPGPLRLDGSLVWEGSGLDSVDLTAQARDNALLARGYARELWEPGEQVDLTVEVSRLDLPDVDTFVQAGLTGRVGGTLTATGTLDELKLDTRLEGQDQTRGRIDIGGVVDANTPSWDGTVDVAGLRVDDLISSLTDPLPVTVKARVSGSGAAWPDEVEVSAEILEAETEVFGVAVDRATADVGVKDGLVGLSDIDLAGPVGAVTGSGAFDTGDGKLHLDLHGERIDPSHLRAFQVPAELDGSRGTADVVVDVDTYADQVDVVVEGSATVAPFYWTRDIRARRVSGTYSVRVAGTDVTVQADARGAGITSYGATVEAARSQGILVEVRESGVTCGGGIEASNAVYPLIPDSLVADLGRGVELASGTGDWSVEVPFGEGAEVVVNVNVDAGAHRLLRYPGRSGTVGFHMTGDQARITTQLDASSTRRLAELDLDLDLTTLAFTFDQLQVAPEPRQTWTAKPGGGFVVDGVGVKDLSLALSSARGELDVSGAVGLEGSQDLSVEVYDLDLAAVARLLPMWLDGLEGYAGGVVTLDGTAAQPDLSADLEVADVAYTLPAQEGQADSDSDANSESEGEGDSDTEAQPWRVVQGLGARIQLDGQAERLGASGRVFVDGTPLADLDLSAPVILAFDRAGFDPRGDLSADVLLLSGGLTRFGELLGVVLPQEGSVQSQLVLQGTPVAPTGRLTLDASLPVQGLDQPVDVTARLDKRKEGALTWRGTAQEGGQDRLELNGSGQTRVDRILEWALEGGQEPDWSQTELYLSELASTIRLQELPVTSLASVAGLSLDVDGRLNGKLDVGGSALTPRVDGRIALDDGRAANVLIDNTELILASSDEGYEIAVTADLEQDLGRSKAERLGSVNIEGDVPLVVDFSQPYQEWDRGELDVRVVADVPIALASAYDGGVREAVGYLQIDGHVGGPVFDPAPDLSLTASEGAGLTYRPMGVRFRDVVVDVGFDQHAITVTQVAAETRPSRVRVDTALSGALSGAVQGGEEAVSGLRRLFTRRKRKKKREQDQVSVGRGRLELSGRARLNEWSIEQLDVKLLLDQALLASSADQLLRLSTTKPLTVQGDLVQPKVRGSVLVDEANLLLDYAQAMGGASREIDPRITVHRGTASVTTEEEEASVFDDVDIELYLDLGRATRGRLIMPLEAVQWLGNEAEALLKIDLRARLSNEDALLFRQIPCRRRTRGGAMKVVPERVGDCGLYHPHVRGVVDIVDGTARVLRADFTLSSSSVSFVGNEVYNPNLDIHGTMEAEDATIRMDIGGTAYDPEIDFTSKDSDQVFAMLALGSSLEGLTAQQVASTLAFALINSALSDVNLPSINIDPSGQVQIGLAIGRNAFVQLTAGGTPRPDENVFEAELEYSLDPIAKGLLLKAGYGAYAVPFWGDILIERRFDKGREPQEEREEQEEDAPSP